MPAGGGAEGCTELFYTAVAHGKLRSCKNALESRLREKVVSKNRKENEVGVSAHTDTPPEVVFDEVMKR